MLRDHPGLARTARRLADHGDLALAGPGVLATTTDAPRPEIRILAATRAFPGTVVTGLAAARLTFWPEVAVPDITLSNGRTESRLSDIRVSRERLPSDLTIQRWGIEVTCPALTALDLLGPGIDQVLLRHAATLGEMARALDLTRGRTGNPERRRLLHDSRDEPWSEAERLAHAVLRAAGITRFRTNVPVRCGADDFLIDIAFPNLRIAVEVDGFEIHRQHIQFERDRRNQTMLTARGCGSCG